MIRILHVIPTLGRGGAERQLVDVVTNTDPTEYEHVVCHLRQPDQFAAEIRAAGRTVINLDLPYSLLWVRAAKRLASIIRERRPDIIQTWLYDADFSARLAWLVRPVPIINTLHMTSYEPETIRAAGWSPLKMRGLQLIDAVTARWSRPFFTACSETVKQSAQQRIGIPESRIRVIYNSIDPDTLRYEPGEPQRLRQSLGIPEDGIVYINVGRLDPQKAQAHLLRAFASIASSAPRAYLAIAGDGQLAADLRALTAELGVAERVRFLGRRGDIGVCLAMADVFVFPSLFEGLPLAPVEAMMTGLPCIASSIKPMREIITNTDAGVLVTPGSVPELAAAMSDLYHDPARREALGRRGQDEALRRFHTRAAMPQWESLYREVVSRNRVNQE